ncbi:M56 family metallopeptidase [Marinifilum flexuosum]|uniref:M56 family metallopeptidase n=1 Tax=Marinifilum flexuosum TaxID=1117708 RepID=UPI0024932EF7|nr:M56 family metallopeptidase [Marinifilum flexuosum]
MIEMFWEYQIKGGIVLAVSVLLYVLVLSNDSFFKRNRIWLVGSLLLPWIVPLITMPVWLKKMLCTDMGATVPLHTFVSAGQMNTNTVQTTNHFSFSIESLGILLYGLISIVFLIRLFYGYASILSLKKSAECKSYKGFSLAVLPDSKLGPFSFFRTIFIPKELEKSRESRLILEHEKAHCAGWHSIDLTLVECMLIFQWWNPFAWWLRNLIANNHEFCVDNIMLKNLSDPKDYQYSLLNLIRGQGQNHLVNNYNQSLTKKRIIMMNKSDKNRTIHRLKGLLLLPILTFSLLAFTNPNQADEVKVEKKSEQTIANTLDLQKYIARNVKYPVIAQENYTQADVIAHVTIDKNGKVKGVKIAQKRQSNLVKIDEVVITAYKTAGGNQDNTQAGIKSLEKETTRILKSLPRLSNQAWVGQKLEFKLKFKLQ